MFANIGDLTSNVISSEKNLPLHEDNVPFFNNQVNFSQKRKNEIVIMNSTYYNLR